jgi:C1A family cysteine protease
MTTTIIPRKTKKYGWLPDLPDHRDQPLRLGRRALPRLPARVDLRTTGFMPPVYDQGYLGSCTANAIAGAFEYEQRRQGLVDYIPSRLFVYFEERKMINTINEDSGAFIRDGLKVVNRLGAPHESIWPYDISRFTQSPSQDVYVDGESHQALGYAFVDNKRQFDVKQCLAAGIPVVFGFSVFSWFENPDSKGFCFPSEGSGLLGGHAVLLVGYFKLKYQWWGIVRNSWGPSWGDGGYCYMPLKWICNYWNADDFWTINQVEA